MPETMLDYARELIEGVGGLDDLERYEMPIYNESERVAAAYWVLKCLANPNNPGSAWALDQIQQRRREALQDA